MRFLRFVLSLVAAAAVVAPASGAQPAPLTLHVILPLTGSGGFLGKNEELTFQAFEAQVNAKGGIQGRPVKFAIGDSGSDPQTTVQLTTNLVAQKVPVIFGDSIAATCSAEMPLLQSGPVAMCLSNAVYPKPGSYMFTASVTTANHISSGLRYLRLSKLLRIAAIESTDASGQQGDHDLHETLASPENKTMALVDNEHFAPTDLTVAAQVARMKAARPDAIVVWTTGVAAGTVLRGLIEAGLGDLPVLISPGNATFAQMKQYAQFLPKQLYFPLPASMVADQVTDPAIKRAIGELVSAIAPTGAKVDISSSFTWDALLIVKSALEQLGPGATAAQIRGYIAGLHSFDGIAGHYDFTKIPQRGIGEYSEYVGRWDAAKGTWIGVSKPGGAPL
jgi:branched-chain amino acid transport system substrate-binding protein